MDYWLDGGWGWGGDFLKECPQSIFTWFYLNEDY